jgi:hypothetical protein
MLIMLTQTSQLSTLSTHAQLPQLLELGHEHHGFGTEAIGVYSPRVREAGAITVELAQRGGRLPDWQPIQIDPLPETPEVTLRADAPPINDRADDGVPTEAGSGDNGGVTPSTVRINRSGLQALPALLDLDATKKTSASPADLARYEDPETVMVVDVPTANAGDRYEEQATADIDYAFDGRTRSNELALSSDGQSASAAGSQSRLSRFLRR